MRWIPVTERLPEEANVLVAYKFGVGECKYYINQFWMNHAEVPEVTHWMPLPPKPDESTPAYQEGELVDIPKPVGDFIISQEDITPVITENGYYYHFGSVCVLLKRYGAKWAASTPAYKEVEELAERFAEMNYCEVKDSYDYLYKGFIAGYAASQPEKKEDSALKILLENTKFAKSMAQGKDKDWVRWEEVIEQMELYLVEESSNRKAGYAAAATQKNNLQ